MSLNCIIIDDERLAQNVLEKYIGMLSSLHLSAKFNNALDAMSYLHEHSVDLIFLDINMPEFSGLEMLKILENPPKVILTTAYSEYALDGFDYGVVDYLLKPIPFERFVKAVNRVNLHKQKDTLSESHSQVSKNIVFKQDGILHKVLFEDILYIEACGNYINVFTKDKKLLIREKMHLVEKKLPSQLFTRTHKSYIVFLNGISKIVGNRVFVNSIEIPMGAAYKQEVLKKFNSFE